MNKARRRHRHSGVLGLCQCKVEVFDRQSAACLLREFQALLAACVAAYVPVEGFTDGA